MTQDKYSTLNELTGYSFPIYISSGTEARAQAIAAQCERAYRFFSKLLNRTSEIHALILAPEQWEKFASYPIFGMPHYVDMYTLVVAGQESEMWRMIMPPMEYLPSDMVQTLRKVYGKADGSISVASFMDLLALHEMLHLFINQATDTVDFHLPRRWVVELFCNLGLHAYMETEEPTGLEHLTAYPQAIVTLGYQHLAHKTLNDFEQLYAGMEPPNFAWYQCQLHVAARHIYEAGGIESVQAMFRTIVRSKDNTSDEQLAVQLRDDVHLNAAKVLTTWPDLKLSEQ
jgi:hypothetical protein